MIPAIKIGDFFCFFIDKSGPKVRCLTSILFFGLGPSSAQKLQKSFCLGLLLDLLLEKKEVFVVGVLVIWDRFARKKMDKYEMVKDLGSGNFGVARLLRNKETKELVAIKYIPRGQKVRSFSSFCCISIQLRSICSVILLFLLGYLLLCL